MFGEHRDYFSGENEGWAGVVASFPSEERMGAVGAPAREAAHWGLGGAFRGSMAHLGARWHRQVIKCTNICPSGTAMLRNAFAYVQWGCFGKPPFPNIPRAGPSASRALPEPAPHPCFSSIPVFNSNFRPCFPTEYLTCKIPHEGKRYETERRVERIFHGIFSVWQFWKEISIFGKEYPGDFFFSPAF